MTVPGQLCEFDVVPVSRRWKISLDGSTTAFEHPSPNAAPARRGHLSITPTADIRSGLSLPMRTDTLDEPNLNQAITAHLHILRILIIRTDRSSE